MYYDRYVVREIRRRKVSDRVFCVRSRISLTNILLANIFILFFNAILIFLQGVVDSEDIPLNLSRELLQNSALIRKLRTVLTNRVLRYLHEQSVKKTEEFHGFYKDYGMFLKEGIVMSSEQQEKVKKN